MKMYFKKKLILEHFGRGGGGDHFNINCLVAFFTELICTVCNVEIAFIFIVIYILLIAIYALISYKSEAHDIPKLPCFKQ